MALSDWFPDTSVETTPKRSGTVQVCWLLTETKSFSLFKEAKKVCPETLLFPKKR
jgi:hypothetical protein